ncbi:MAG TPA: molybdopterin-dependent oxidoreductase [Verrucomicrobiae bacterium]|jgi:NADH-quinone oxidoreductase subunit G|nr:molybdopterin-dependent oxidoreductase [Verrucomicrobiae bacterium]
MAQNAQPQLVNLTIDGVSLSVPKGTLLVEAAKTVKQEIPVYCYHPKLGPAGLCRVCLVEIEGTPKLQIACNTPVAEGMVVHTQNAKVNAGRSMIVELLLVNHPLDCPICDKGGECDLQDYAMAYGAGASSTIDPKLSKPKGVDLGPTIVLDEERCVVCQRCVRFDDIIADERQLVLKDRGVNDIIATATGQPYRHNFTGNVTEICPVGALTSKTYRFKSRPWDLARTQTSCTQCSVGCQMFADVRFGAIQRTMSVEHDDAISDGWLCDRGRYNVGFYASRERLTQPLYKQDGRFVQIGWDDAFALWAGAIKKTIAGRGGVAMGAIGGGRLTNEEAYVLQHVFRALGVKNVDWRSGAQRQASPGKAGGSLVELENAQAIVIVGQSPAELAPVMDLRIKKAQRKQGARVERFTTPDALSAALDSHVKRVALVWDGVDGAQVRAATVALSNYDVTAYIASEQSNARGAEAMGMLPNFGPGYQKVDAGLGGDALLAAARDGKIDMLYLAGVNPALNHPDGALIAAALEKTPFVVVSELFLTQTARVATLVLPAKGAFEKSGTTTNLAGDVLPVNGSLQAPDGVLSDLEVLVGLAQYFDLTMPTVEELDAAVIANAAKVAPFELGDASLGAAAHAGDSGDGPLRVVIATNSFAGGGTAAHDPRLETLRPLPQAALSASDARALDVAIGDYIDLEAGQTVMHDLLVAVVDAQPAGTVVLIGGLPDDPANILGVVAGATVTNVRRTSAVEA